MAVWLTYRIQYRQIDRQHMVVSMVMQSKRWLSRNIMYSYEIISDRSEVPTYWVLGLFRGNREGDQESPLCARWKTKRDKDQENCNQRYGQLIVRLWFLWWVAGKSFTLAFITWKRRQRHDDRSDSFLVYLLRRRQFFRRQCDNNTHPRPPPPSGWKREWVGGWTDNGVWVRTTTVRASHNNGQAVKTQPNICALKL